MVRLIRASDVERAEYRPAKAVFLWVGITILALFILTVIL
jgi:hypothetical protein